MGRHQRGVDRSRRVLLPAEWRAEGAPSRFMVLLWPPPNGQFLLVLPPSRWEAMLQHLADVPLGDESGATIERYISSNAFSKTLDAYGRLPLPEEVASLAGIKEAALLLGRLQKFEVWAPEQYRQRQETAFTQEVKDKFRTMRL